MKFGVNIGEITKWDGSGRYQKKMDLRLNSTQKLVYDVKIVKTTKRDNTSFPLPM